MEDDVWDSGFLTKETIMGIHILISRWTFFKLDHLGLHVSVFGRELAWTRGFGLSLG
jgi:hypothetical protein